MSNGKSADEEDKSKKGSSNIKSAADLLLKGGTLLSESCAKCRGVQVRYKEETVCVSCGRIIKEKTNNDGMTKQIEEEQQQQPQSQPQPELPPIQDFNLSKKKEFKVPAVFDSSITNTISTKIITDKINFLITTLENENDILIQNTKLDLISKYLEVLGKLKIISQSRET